MVFFWLLLLTKAGTLLLHGYGFVSDIHLVHKNRVVTQSSLMHFQLRLEHLEAERSLSPVSGRGGAMSPRARSLSPRPGSACSHCSEYSHASSRSGSRPREYVTSASQQTQSRQTVRRVLPPIPISVGLSTDYKKSPKGIHNHKFSHPVSIFIVCWRQIRPN